MNPEEALLLFFSVDNIRYHDNMLSYLKKIEVYIIYHYKLFNVKS